ncbi:MAG: hypothetical protein QME75_02565 [Deltaproteobacteria bacterium]|nr:hypothetical protein [Deltaproteobacteria bacterium]
MTRHHLVTVGLSSHRLEVLPYARREMQNHEAIVLEEAPEPDFPALLAGKLRVDGYLADKDPEFPAYSRKQALLLRELHQEGKGIFQVEPYLERLIRIHELLAEGLTRSQVESRPGLKEVYDAEARASAALLNFYARAHNAPFPQVVAAVQDFARADAARFRVRDDLRAKALLPLASSIASLYVEAGYIHLFLVKRLRQLLAGQAHVLPVFLLAGPSLKTLGRPRPMGPGDLLTLYYIFNAGLKKEKEEVLAARSLIYIKLLRKDEMAPTDDRFTPHMDDEIQAYRLTADLTFQDCAALYPEIRRLPPQAAGQAVRRYLGKNCENLLVEA